jgi:hypothetical protein
MADDSKPTPKELAALKAQKAEADRDKKEAKAYKDSTVYPETEDVVTKEAPVTGPDWLFGKGGGKEFGYGYTDKELAGELYGGARTGRVNTKYKQPTEDKKIENAERMTPRWREMTPSSPVKAKLTDEKYASGGSIRGGGIESRGKTKGRFV